MLKKTIALAAVAATLTAFAPSPEAEAGKRFRLHFGHHHFHHHHRRPHHYVYTGPSCRYYYKKWKWTGSKYWKRKYYRCIS